MSEQWTALERNVRGILDACESHNGIEHPDSFVSEIYVYAKNVEAAVGEAKRRESERPIHGFSASTNLPDTAGLLGRLGVAEARVAELERALPNPERLEEIARLLDLFDRVAELADDLLPGEKENYRAIDHTQMQDDLRAWARAAREALGVRGEQPKHTKECDDHAFIHHAATGGDADCICGAQGKATSE